MKLSNVPTVIFMHHFPIEVSNILFKGINLLESNNFKELISSYPNIIGIYCGHYHYFKQDKFASKTCWISPSTAPSYSVAEDNKAKINYTKPSYSLHTFNSKNEFISKVIRL
ncbi:MAG: hypothetical protein P8P83_01040 [Rickettsiaceae bacterium]|nr:hypothetical protein [Rickettsiaceae bacterium]